MDTLQYMVTSNEKVVFMFTVPECVSCGDFTMVMLMWADLLSASEHERYGYNSCKQHFYLNIVCLFKNTATYTAHIRTPAQTK